MKKSKTAKFLIAGLVLLLAGVIIFVISMSVLEWDFIKLDSATYEAKTFTVSDETEQISAVKISVNSFPVNVKSGDTLKVDYYEASNSEVNVAIENGVLKITEKRDHNFFKSVFNFGALNHKYEVIVPDGINIEFNGANGNINLYRVHSQSCLIKSTNLNLKMDGCEFHRLNLDSTNADIAMDSCDITNVNLESTNLDLSANSCNIGELTARGTNGDFEIKNGNYDVMQITATNNDVEIQSSSINNLTVKGTNLDADITIKGIKTEYTITTKGKRLPAQQTGTTDKEISISGTNNDVELKFV